MNHVAQLLVRDALLAFALLFNETPLLHYVARTEKEHAIAGQTVAPGPPRFLIITLDVLRQIVMNNETDIRFVDPHSERDRCRDHACIVAQKLLLMFCSIRRLEPRMIWLRFDSIGIQLCCQRIRCPSARTINDAAFVRPAANQLEHLFVGRRFWNDAVGQVCTIETRDVALCAAEMQLIDYVFADALCCRRR